MSKPSTPVLDAGTLGESRHRLELAGMIVTETVHEAGCATELHAHARPGFNLVLEGRYGERLRGSFDVHPPATLIVKPAGEPHANRFDDTGARCLLVEFEPAAIEHLREATDALDRPGVWAAGALAASGVRALRSLRGEGPPVVAIEEAILEILRGTGRRRRMARERGRPAWLGEVRDRIHASAPDRLRLRALAADAGVHPAHLSETFRRAYGTTVSGYVERLRLERAVRALVETDDPLARIAVRCGFYDHAHLTRTFRRATGMTPSEFRAALRG